MKTVKLAAAVVFFLLAAGPVRAEGPATVCEGRLLAVLLKTLGGQWVTVWQGNEPLDLMNSRSPSIIIPNKGNIPAGKYSNIKLRISETFRVSGYDGPYKTKEGGKSTLGGSAATMERLPGDILSYSETAPTWTTGDMGTITTHLDFDYQDEDDFIEIFRAREFQDPIVIGPKSVIKIMLSINLGTSIQFAMPGSLALNIPKDKALVFMLPQKISEMVIRVDATGLYVKGGEVTVEL